LERIEPIAYRLDLSDGLTGIHDVFHISQLKKYRPDTDHVLNEKPLLLQQDLSYVEKPVKIIERSVKELRNKKISMVKVLWEHHGAQNTTWETEERVRKKYPRLL
jgi:predicted Ser/Thr protein kinase